MTVELSTIADQVRSYGTVKAQDLVSVSPQVSNRLTDIYVDLGDTVEAGQLMAKIYDKTFRDQLSQAEAQLAQSRIALRRDSAQFERQRQLLEMDLVSDSEYEIALATYRNTMAQLESARASLTQAQENFNFTEVRAPVNGVVVSRSLERVIWHHLDKLCLNWPVTVALKLVFSYLYKIGVRSVLGRVCN